MRPPRSAGARGRLRTRPLMLVLPVMLVLALAGCSGDRNDASGGTGSGSGAPATAPAGASGSVAAASGSASASGSAAASVSASGSGAPGPQGSAASEGQFTNPVIDRYFADPFILEDEGTYYAYGTQSFEASRFQTARSTDLVNWEMLPSALANLPRWSLRRTWAPEVFRIGDQYVMYYTTNAPGIDNPKGDPAQCLSIALSDSPEGPFRDDSEEPFLCQPELGGSIDATYFRDADDRAYLIWKNDGNCCSLNTRLYIQELDETGLELQGKPVDLGLVDDATWEAGLVEAPTVLLRDGTYYLFYSGGHFSSPIYAVGYATADTVTGPYVDAPENPILISKGTAAGPGHQTIVTDKDGDLWMAYHAWDATAIGEERGGQRKLWLDELVFEDGKPVVKGPDSEPQPVP